METHYLPRSREPSVIAGRAEALLHRYPNLSETELAELINLMPRLPLLDFGLMTADPVMSSRLDAFHRDHGHKVRPTPGTVAALLMIPVTLGVAAALFWATT